MDLHRRKLWGDRGTWVLVGLATVFVVLQWTTQGGAWRFYVLLAWAVIVAWLVFVSELRIGRREPRAAEGAFFTGWAALVGEVREEVDGTRRRGWTGTAPGRLELTRAGIRWSPRREKGPQRSELPWEEVYAWRIDGVLPILWRASAYLTVTLEDGRELTFHVSGARRWRKALRDARIIGPVRRPGEEEPAAAAEPEPQPAPVVEPEEPTVEPQPVPVADAEPAPVAAPEAATVEIRDEEPKAVERDEEHMATATQRSELEAVIGLECHVELSTDSKVFCGCPTRFGAEPNTQVCPVCTGQPGTLPVLNERAVEYALRIGLALSCRIAPESFFHRKNYFYPDMPKNYQISQYDVPLASGGYLEVEAEGEWRRIGIHRVHLEEDTGKTSHVSGTGRIAEATHAKVDYNRAGVPLVEIVSEPDIRTAEEARAFLTELRALLQAIGVSDVRMEEGSLRCDANVSVRPRGAAEYGVKAEVKNMNSIRSVGRALDYETGRQRSLIEAGETVAQETRHFDENTGTTASLRTKEYAFDYRYFPEPDLVPVAPDPAWVERIGSRLPELPAVRRDRFVGDYGISAVDARTLTSTPALGDAFEWAVRTYGGDGKRIARWYLGELASLANERGVEPHDVGVAPEQVAELQKLIDAGTVSDSAAKTTVLKKVIEERKSPAQIVEAEGLAQISEASELAGMVDEVIAGNPDLVEQIRGGKTGAVNALVGQVMKKTRGQANPQVVRELLDERLTPS